MPKKEQRHTPTPWELTTGEDGAVVYRGDTGTIADLTGPTVIGDPKANGEFIVRAVNAHDKLVRAVDYFLGVVNGKYPPSPTKDREIQGLMDDLLLEQLKP